MAKTEVYSWRVTPSVLSALQHRARELGISVGSLLERLTELWLERERHGRRDDDAEQAKLRKQASRSFGAISGGDPRRAERARFRIRSRLKRRRGG